MKILITGATGFLGQRLVRRLVAEGHAVFATGRDRRIGAELRGATFLPTDLSRPTEFASWPTSIDQIVHSAALSSPWGSYRDFYQCNVVATQNVTAYAQRAGCQRFIHISTPSLYVDRVPRLNVRETDYLPDFALNYYISTKKTAERLVLEARGLPAVVLRPQGLVGRGDRAIFPRIIRVARKGFVPRIGSGMTLTDLTHVENVVEAVVCALRAGPGSIGEVYNVSNGQPVELYGVIESLLSELKMPFRWRPLPFKLAYHVAAGLEGISRTVLLGREPLLTRYTACTLGLSRTLNIEKARRELDYEPRHTLAQAMDEVVREMREA